MGNYIENQHYQLGYDAGLNGGVYIAHHYRREARENWDRGYEDGGKRRQYLADELVIRQKCAKCCAALRLVDRKH